MGRKTEICTGEGADRVCLPPPDPVACDPVATRICTPEGVCSCVLPVPTQMCKVAIVYANGGQGPSDVQMISPGPGCDAAGLELALAVMLAKLMGMK